jgi:hypothetical protein
MLQSAVTAAKLLSGNKLTSREVHLVGAAGPRGASYIVAKPTDSIKQPLNFDA